MFVVTVVSQGLLECEREHSWNSFGTQCARGREEVFLSLPASGVRASLCLVGPYASPTEDVRSKGKCVSATWASWGHFPGLCVCPSVPGRCSQGRRRRDRPLSKNLLPFIFSVLDHTVE